MTTRPTTVLVVGATGTIARLVVHEAIRRGYRHDLASRAQTALGEKQLCRLILRGSG
jgi:uncharacterized protein YbjT (DUF2867 family)